MKKRILSIALCLIMVCALVPLSASAANCPHHTVCSQAVCGYVPASGGVPCDHVHNSACGYVLGHACDHVHSAACGAVAVSCNKGCDAYVNGELSHRSGCAYQPAGACTHVCGDGTCGYVQGHACSHVCSDGTCSYKPGVSGHACNFYCTICNAPAVTVSAPYFSHTAGTVPTGTAISLYTATSGAQIYYTTDGSTPTAASTRYYAPIAVNHGVTIKAIAIKDGASSGVSSASYTSSGGGSGSSIHGVTVSANSAYMNKGSGQQLYAKVSGSNDQRVNWSVYSKNSGLSSGTYVSSSGYLSVSSYEKSTTIVVRATSVANPAFYGEYYIHLHSYTWQHNASKHWQACACGSTGTSYNHTYNNWRVTKAPTKEVKGTIARSCTVCGYTQYDSVTYDGVPRTGDDSNLGLWSSLLFLSLAGSGIVLYRLRRKEH